MKILESDAQFLILDLEKKWDKFETEFRDRIEKKREDEKASRIFDKYIETNFLKICNGPDLAKEFLSLNRLQRRLLSNALLEFIELNKKRSDKSTAFRTLAIDNFGVSFFYHEKKEVSEENFVDIVLQSIMVKSAQLRNYSEEHLLGLSIYGQGSIWKIKYANKNDITSEIEKYTDEIIAKLGWFKNIREKALKIEEYPKKNK